MNLFLSGDGEHDACVFLLGIDVVGFDCFDGVDVPMDFDTYSGLDALVRNCNESDSSFSSFLMMAICLSREARNLYVYDPNPNSFDCPPDSYHPSHPTYETYSYDSYGNDSQFGYDCQPQFPLHYESKPGYNENYPSYPYDQFPLHYESKPGYNENYPSYPYDSSSLPQQYLCCARCGGPHETCHCDQLIFDEPYCKHYGGRMNYQCQPMNQDSYNSNSLGSDQPQPPQSPVIHQPPQELSIQEMEDLKQKSFCKRSSGLILALILPNVYILSAMIVRIKKKTRSPRVLISIAKLGVEKQPREEKKSFRQRDEKKGKSDRKCFRCGDLNHLIGDCPKPSCNKDQKAFIGSSWSDNENDAKDKTNDETCLVAQSSNEGSDRWIEGGYNRRVVIKDLDAPGRPRIFTFSL
uniref:Alpha/beta hydrolases superfamily protein n=1 Tax=Tanacetum cinerariifolium TaxID=118510 RepID=A0A6L2MHY7_TANCI|nr:alpha/beta hydrolases superfamily protein [Tanacetum cinerariifolium]